MRIALCTLAAGLVCLAGVAAAQSVEERHSVQTGTMLAAFAIKHSLDAQTAFNEARAIGDNAAMEEAAARLLNNLDSAQEHLAVLDARVDATAYSERLDGEVAELLSLVERAYDAVDDFILDRDMAGFGRALDNSADWFTALRADGRRVLDEVSTHRE